MFQKATKRAARLRMALIGPAGSGKTYTALSIATHLGGPIAVLDTEHGSASKYADLFTFDVLELESFDPRRYVEAIHAADAAGYKALIIDSLSHAWMGKDGALELKDKATAASRSGNSFDAWRTVTPLHNQLVESILASRCHVFATLRTKTEYVVEQDDRGKNKPRKVGLQPVQRDGLEYEFDVVGDLDQENNLVIGKTRCPALQGQVYQKAGKEVAGVLWDWLQGEPIPDAPPFDPERDALIGRLKTARAGIKQMGQVLQPLTPALIAGWSHDKLLSETEIAERDYDSLRTPTAAEVAA